MRISGIITLLAALLIMLSCGGDEYLFDWQEQLAKDLEAIDKYLEENNIEAKKSSSGLRYVIHDYGTGSAPVYGQSIIVHYEGRLIDGTVFDSSYERGEPSEFRVGTLIQGFNEGLSYIGEGGSISLYMPSRIGYGTSSTDNIPENSILFFDVELLNIK
ncbi:FKBP-type peptidyl-prolyl cis-trans isomerase [Bacteroidota bacterium]